MLSEPTPGRAALLQGSGFPARVEEGAWARRMAGSRGETKIVFPFEKQCKPLGISSSANIAVVFLISGLKKKNRLEPGPVGLLGCSQAGSWPGQIHPSSSLPLPAPWWDWLCWGVLERGHHLHIQPGPREGGSCSPWWGPVHPFRGCRRKEGAAFGWGRKVLHFGTMLDFGRMLEPR